MEVKILLCLHFATFMTNNYKLKFSATFFRWKTSNMLLNDYLNIVNLNFIVSLSKEFFFMRHHVPLRYEQCRELGPTGLAIYNVLKNFKRQITFRSSRFRVNIWNEPRHDKTNIVGLRPAWILIRLGRSMLVVNALRWFFHGTAQIF
jgi:hypothetical protein